MAQRRPGRRVDDGVLAGYYKDGRTYRPPLLTIPTLAPSDWIRDDLPDLLWPLVLVYLNGDEGAGLFREVQELVLQAVPSDLLDGSSSILDGRLTSVERFPTRIRRRVLRALRASRLTKRAIPAELVGILRLYRSAPGSWLTVRPWRDIRTPSNDASLELLGAAIAQAVRDGRTNALVKTPPLGWNMLRGQLHLQQETIDTLINYPTDSSRRSAADALIRSLFLTDKAMAGIDLTRARLTWAKSFWNKNWSLSPCIPVSQIRGADETAASEPQGEADDRARPHSPDLPDISVKARDILYRRYDAFMCGALGRRASVNLMDPECVEVVTGLVARAARSILATVEAPNMWSGEHGSSTLRIIFETEVVLRWLDMHSGRGSYHRYQAFGRGKRKLMRLHLDALVDQLGDDAPQSLIDSSEAHKQKTGGEWGEELQEVSLDATFTGKTLRQMAEEVGQLDQYRYVYQPASGVAHGEWWAVEDYAMERCANPLHRFHLLPASDPRFPITEQFPDVLLAAFDGILSVANEALRLRVGRARTGG
jgi:hypothetical protein